jgi:hypothetical protein
VDCEGTHFTSSGGCLNFILASDPLMSLDSSPSRLVGRNGFLLCNGCFDIKHL